MPETADRAVHQARIDDLQIAVAQAEFVQDADTKVLDDHIAASRKFTGKGEAAFVFEVEREALLVAIAAQVIGRLPAKKRRPPVARLIADARAFDLDDLSAQVAQHHRAVRSRQMP